MMFTQKWLAVIVEESSKGHPLFFSGKQMASVPLNNRLQAIHVSGSKADDRKRKEGDLFTSN